MALFPTPGKKQRRRKLSATEKKNLPPQPEMVMHLKDGRKRMVWTGKYIQR